MSTIKFIQNSRIALFNTKRLYNSGLIMKKAKILMTRPDISQIAIDTLSSKCDLTLWNQNSAAPRDFILKNIAGKDGLYCFLSDTVDKELLDTAGPNLKVVSTFSVGYDHIDLNECKKRGIRVGYTPDVLTEATAELTMGLLLCTSRRLMEAHNEAVTGGWTTWAPSWMTGPGLAGSTVGIVGFGRIGQSVALKVRAFNTKRILYYNRTEKPNDASAERVPLDHLLAQSDFVICCLPLMPDTKYLFNAETFAKMKNTSVFINTSRGGLVDQDSLIDALQKKTIWAAGLDVTNPEPLPLSSPLFKLKNCTILPHIGSATNEARTAMAKLAADNLLAALESRSMPAEL